MKAKLAKPTPPQSSVLPKKRAAKPSTTGCDVLIVDTAGRLHIDDQLMDEMQSLKRLLNPQEILFVADSMTGQDAVRSADEFHKKLTLTGVVLTKMDGDARGGAALSIRQVTGQPIKFIGIGEKYDALEPFHPDRIVSRILGMGDILSLIEKAESQIDKKKASELASKRFEPAMAFRWRISAISCGKCARWARMQSLDGHVAQYRRVFRPAKSCRQSRREADQPRRSHHQFHDRATSATIMKPSTAAAANASPAAPAPVCRKSTICCANTRR